MNKLECSISPQIKLNKQSERRPSAHFDQDKKGKKTDNQFKQKPKLKGYAIRKKNISTNQLMIFTNNSSRVNKKQTYKPFDANKIIMENKKRIEAIKEKENCNVKDSADISNLNQLSFDCDTKTDYTKNEDAKLIVPKMTISSTMKMGNLKLSKRLIEKAYFSSKSKLTYFTKDKCQCKCGPDNQFNCCVKAAEWLRIAYKGKYQSYKYRQLYEVTFPIMYRELLNRI